MPRQWTDKQNEALSVLDRDVCVAAGAGSGKTGVLVERWPKTAFAQQALEWARADASPSASGNSLAPILRELPVVQPNPKAIPPAIPSAGRDSRIYGSVPHRSA